MKRYNIMRCNPESADLLATVEGPNRPSIKTLYRQFSERFGVVELPALTAECDYLDLGDRLSKREAAVRRANNPGYIGDDIPTCFVRWLIGFHGFSEVTATNFFISR